MGAKHGANRQIGQGTAAPGVGAVHVENQVWALLPPWLAAAGLFLTGGVAHVAWGNPGRVGLVSGFLGASAVALTGLTVWVSRPRHPVVRTLSAVTVALAGLWMILATNWGWGHGLWWLYPLPTMVVCVAWNIKHLLRGNGGDHTAHGPSAWGDVADKVSLLRATIRKQEQVGPRQVIKAELEPGTTLAQVRQEASVVASLMKAPSNGVTVTGDPDHPDDSSRVEVAVMPMDVLTMTFAWPGPSYPGASIADHPIRIGTYQDGEPVDLELVGRRGGKVVSHIMIQGMTGAGKSELLQEIADEVLSRTDTELEYIDTGDKAEQTVGPLLSGLARPPSLTDAEAKKHLEDLDREIKPRAQHLAERGMREWEKGCGLSFKVVIIDEAGDSIAADKKRFTRLARKLRSLGVLLICAQQNFAQRTMPVDARKNFGTGICCGISEAGDAGWVLSDTTIEGGAQPWLWRNFKPGYFYIEDGGIAQHRWVVPARACLTDPQQVRASIEANAVHRWNGAPLQLADLTPDDDEDGGVEPSAPAGGDEVEPPMEGYEPPESMRAELDRLDPDAPLPADGVDMDMPLGPQLPKPSTEAASQMLEQMLDDMADARRLEFRRSDLVKAGLLMTTGRSKSWVTGELKRHVASGRLEVVGDPADGVYRQRELVHAA